MTNDDTVQVPRYILEDLEAAARPGFSNTDAADAAWEMLHPFPKPMKCVHCGVPLVGEKSESGLYRHEGNLWRCQREVPYGHMGHPAMPCPPGDINPCVGFDGEATCTHVYEKATA